MRLNISMLRRYMLFLGHNIIMLLVLLTLLYYGIYVMLFCYSMNCYAILCHLMICHSMVYYAIFSVVLHLLCYDMSCSVIARQPNVILYQVQLQLCHAARCWCIFNLCHARLDRVLRSAAVLLGVILITPLFRVL